jgi:hypothetical protein
MGAIYVLDVPGTRRSGGVVGVVGIKKICFPFVAGGGAGTVRDQGEGRLNIFLLDTTRTAATNTITTTTGRALLVLLLLLLLRLLQVMRAGSIAWCVRDRIG